MSAFHDILAGLVEADSAAGAIFVDDSGETVDLAVSEGRDESVGAAAGNHREEMRLLAAYAGIYLRQASRFCKAESVGDVGLVSIACEGLHLHALRLREGYSLIVINRSASVTAVSRRRFAAAAAEIEVEAFGVAPNAD